MKGACYEIEAKNTGTHFFIIVVVLISCKKLNGPLRDSREDPPVYEFGTSIVTLHKTKVYPDSATLQVNGYFMPLPDNTVVEVDSTFSSLISFSDASFVRIISLGIIPDRKHFYSWRVIGRDQDSLSGGITPAQIIPVNTPGNKTFTFEINFKHHVSGLLSDEKTDNRATAVI